MLKLAGTWLSFSQLSLQVAGSLNSLRQMRGEQEGEKRDTIHDTTHYG